MRLFQGLCIAALLIWAAPVMAQNAATPENMEILKEKLKADKKLLVAGNMDLSDAEAKAFWPLYDGYQHDLDQINQRLAKTIGEYAEAFNKGPVPDDTAKKLMNEVIAVEQSEAQLKRSYAEKLNSVLPASKTARYIQIETKIRAIIKMELAQQIPLIF